MNYLIKYKKINKLYYYFNIFCLYLQYLNIKKMKYLIKIKYKDKFVGYIKNYRLHRNC